MTFPRFAKLGIPLVLLLVPFFASPAQADNAQAQRASAFIQKLGDGAIGILADKAMPADEAAKRFRNMLHENFDLNLLGKFALGPTTWKSLNPQQQGEYLKLFEALVVEIYAERFKTYNGEVFKAGQAHAENSTDSYVTSTIAKPGEEGVQVDWRVREGGAHPRIIDVIVEGVSMSVTKRSEFASAIQQQGGDFNAFLELLRQKVNQGDTSVQDNK
jgi:phospholipid transport system substrate-binding protein